MRLRDTGRPDVLPTEAPAERRAATERVPSERKVHTTMVSEAADQAIGMPLVVPGPWTREAREQAIRRETRDAFIGYFRKAIKTRNWTPWDDFPLDEMREFGDRLSEDTVTIIEAYLGVEDYVGDYVQDGLSILPTRERRGLQIAWGNEELKH